MKNSNSHKTGSLFSELILNSSYAFTINRSMHHSGQLAHAVSNFLPWVEDLLRTERGRADLARGKGRKRKNIGKEEEKVPPNSINSLCWHWHMSEFSFLVVNMSMHALKTIQNQVHEWRWNLQINLGWIGWHAAYKMSVEGWLLHYG